MGKTITDFLADDEARPVLEAWLQAESDKRVTAAIKSHDLKNPKAGDAAAKLAARLEQLEGALAAEKAAHELKFHVYKRAAEAGVDYTLVDDIHFVDAAAADKKIAALAAAVSKKRIEDVNRDMIEHAFRPGSGNGPAPALTLSSMSDKQRRDLLEKDPAEYQRILLSQAVRQAPGREDPFDLDRGGATGEIFSTRR